jgi:pyruvate dehydrogenase E1 component alpha subunit
MVQLLDENGELHEHPEYSSVIEELSEDELQRMYSDMVTVRALDDEGVALQRKGELGTWGQLLGQEAAQIGIGHAARPQDFMFPSYRENGVAYCRGLPLDAFIKLSRGASHGGWDPHEYNFNLQTLVIGTQALHAVGYGMGRLRKGKVGTGDVQTDEAIVAFFGDGATSQGDVNEALVFSSSFKAPVLFFVQNNQWAISVPKQRQSPHPLYKRGEGFGVPGIRVDGNDPLASYAVSRVMLDSIRNGDGPKLIEAFTYRMGAHTTSDEPSRYRPSSEEDFWRERDPIARFRKYLKKSHRLSESYFEEVEATANTVVHKFRTICNEMPDPHPEVMFDHIYGTEHPLVTEERQEFQRMRKYLMGN